MASASLMHETGHSKPVHWDDPEGYEAEVKGGRGSGWRDTGTLMADLYQCMAKIYTILQSN